MKRRTKPKAKPAAKTAKAKAKPAPKTKPTPVAPTTGLMLVDELQCGPEFLELVVDVDKLTVTVSGTVDEQELARFASFDELCAGYPAVWQQIIDKYGEPTNDYAGDGEPRPMDVQAEWIRRERRANARASADDGAWDGKLAKARAVLAKFDGKKAATEAVPTWLRSEVDMSANALAESLEYVIEIHRAGTAPLGASKLGGSPHLPAELAWPEQDGEPMYFLAQLALAEIAAADVSRLVPARGMLYAFITESAHGRLLYTESTNLTTREAPFEFPDYMEHLHDEARLTFAPAFYFNQLTGDTGGPGAIAAALPAKLRAQIAKILGTSAEPSDAFGGDRIFGGDPVDWQSMGTSYLKNPLFAQLSYSNGNFSIGIDPDDLRIGFFDDADSGYCGT